MEREVQLTDACVELSGFHDRDFDEAAYARSLAARVIDLVDVDAAGVLLTREGGHLEFAAASAHAVKLLHTIELRFNDGPGVAGFRRGEVVTLPDVHDAQPWLAFRQAALRAGYHAVHVVPLRHQGEIVGTLTLFGRTPGPLAPDEQRIALALGTLAAAGLLTNRSLRKAETLAGQLQTALNSRIAVEQAKGILAERHGVSTERAFEVMRAFARRDRRKIDEVARDVINDSPSVARLVTRAG